jgi:DnaK suppressor protein
MTNITTINGTEIARRKAALETTLREALGSSILREELEIEHLADPLDQIRSNTDREIAVQRLDGQARLVREVRAALERIEEGAYGSCEQCEEPIGKRRLDALPWARLCVTCQDRQESENRGASITFDAAA